MDRKRAGQGKLDGVSVAGLAIGLAAILLGQVLEGGQIGSLWQLPALVIVFGGTCGAIMLQYPFPDFVRGLGAGRWIFTPPPVDAEATIVTLIEWSHIARREGLLALDARLEQQGDPFMAKGLQLLVDGIPPDNLRAAMDIDITMYEEEMRRSVRVWESAGGYSPTIGIIGAVMGLIHVMENLSDPARLGAGIATAFVATIYGVGLANLVYLPIGNRLKSHLARLVRQREMIVDGLHGIATGENPRIIEGRMRGYRF